MEANGRVMHDSTVALALQVWCVGAVVLSPPAPPRPSRLVQHGPGVVESRLCGEELGLLTLGVWMGRQMTAGKVGVQSMDE